MLEEEAIGLISRGMKQILGDLSYISVVKADQKPLEKVKGEDVLKKKIEKIMSSVKGLTSFTLLEIIKRLGAY